MSETRKILVIGNPSSPSARAEFIARWAKEHDTEVVWKDIAEMAGGKRLDLITYDEAAEIIVAERHRIPAPGDELGVLGVDLGAPGAFGSWTLWRRLPDGRIHIEDEGEISAEPQTLRPPAPPAPHRTAADHERLRLAEQKRARKAAKRRGKL